MKRIIKDARYYINKILFQNHSKEDWLSLKLEVNDWWKTAPPTQKEEYVTSGAGECLGMICDSFGFNV